MSSSESMMRKKHAAALAAFGGLPEVEAGTVHDSSDRDVATDADVDRAMDSDDVALGMDDHRHVMKAATEVSRSAGGLDGDSGDSPRIVDQTGATIKRGFQPGDKAYSAAVPSTAATPAGAPPMPPYPYFLKYSHQEVTGANYDTVFNHVVALLRAAKTRMSVKKDAGRIACYLYDDLGQWVQFKVRFFGLPSDDVEGDPHFAVEFDRQQGNAFLLENVYRLTMLGLNEAGMELHGQCRTAQQVLGRGPALPETDDGNVTSMIHAADAATASGSSAACSAGDSERPDSEQASVSDDDGSSLATSLKILMDMMQGEWADASEEALGSLARLASDDASGRAKAAIAKQPGLLAMLLAMSSGQAVGEAPASMDKAAPGARDMTMEEALSAAEAVLRRMDEDAEDDEDEDDEDDEDDDGTGYHVGGGSLDGSSVVESAQKKAAVADLAACFMRKRVDVVRRTLAAIALKQCLDGSDEAREAVLSIPGGVDALVAASCGQEDAKATDGSISGAFRPAIASLRHTCIRSLEYLCDSEAGKAAVAGAKGGDHLARVVSCDAADEHTRESARHVVELLA